MNSGEKLIKSIMTFVSLKKGSVQGTVWLTNNRLLIYGKPLKYVVNPQTFPTFV